MQKKREEKADKKEEDSGLRMKKSFKMFVGDDTGLLKGVSFSYNY